MHTTAVSRSADQDIYLFTRTPLKYHYNVSKVPPVFGIIPFLHALFTYVTFQHRLQLMPRLTLCPDLSLPRPTLGQPAFDSRSMQNDGCPVCLWVPTFKSLSGKEKPKYTQKPASGCTKAENS